MVFHSRIHSKSSLVLIFSIHFQHSIHSVPSLLSTPILTATNCFMWYQSAHCIPRPIFLQCVVYPIWLPSPQPPPALHFTWLPWGLLTQGHVQRCTCHPEPSVYEAVCSALPKGLGAGVLGNVMWLSTSSQLQGNAAKPLLVHPV